MTAVLLDTHVLVWILDQPHRVGRRARRVIERADERGELLISAVSFGEIAVLIEERRVSLGGPAFEVRGRLLRDGFTELPIDGDQAIDATGLIGLPGDPMDRFIVAAARHARAQLVTADAAILAWDGALNRLDATE